MSLTIRPIKLLAVIIMLLVYVSYVFMVNTLSVNNSEDGLIYTFSIISVISFAFCVITWKKLTGQLFSLYTIFMLFAFLFHLGQCFLWAFNIHVDGEIGSRLLYSMHSVSKTAILKAQMISICGLLAFHTGALFGYDGFIQRRYTVRESKTDVEKNRRILYQVSRLFAIFAIPVQMYLSIRMVILTRVFGYGSWLYNSSVTQTNNTILNLISMSFFPSLVGMIIGSNYKKSVVRFCYTIFGVFAIISIASGNRGEWLYPLIILIWMRHTFYKNINFKNAVLYFILALLIIQICVGIRDTRSITDINLLNLFGVSNAESNAVVSAVSEMGSSMAPTVLLANNGYTVYPFGNSYLLTIPGTISDRVIKMFIPNYVGLGTWFSSEFIGIKYGAGFSLVAEALINSGEYLFVVPLILLGYLISSLLSVDQKYYSYNPIQAFLGVTTAEAFIAATRNTLVNSTHAWLYSVGFMLLVFTVIKNHRRKV